MAFTDEERAKIRRAMGYWDIASGYYHRLEGKLSQVGSDAEGFVRGWLAEIDTIDTQLASARACRIKAKKVEDIVVAGQDEIEALYREGNRLCRQIGITLGLRVLHYPYKSGSMSGSTQRI